MARKDTVLLLEPTLDDPDEALALRYLYDHLDEQIEGLLQDAEGEGPSPELATLLRLRYGIDPAHFSYEPSEPVAHAAARTLAKQREPDFSCAQGKVYVTPWSSGDAIPWFRMRLANAWPTKAEYPFLAADVVTLWTACVAMDLAPCRKKSFADDRFPAPPLLIRGPTGVGKELLAEAVHLKSGKPRPGFGPINCGGLSPELLESELFGHVKGAFTGAVEAKKGFVEMHETVFLDEVGDMPASIQVRLLRFLNTGEYRPVGSNELKHKHPRIISATLKDPQSGLREDLYHRLRGRVLQLRSLDQRRASILPLVKEFLGREAAAREVVAPNLTAEALVALHTYAWPGNMRELKYATEYMLENRRRTGNVTLGDLPVDIQRAYLGHPAAHRTAFALKVSQEDGESTRLRELRAVYATDRQRATPSARAATTERVTTVLRRVGDAVNLAEMVQPHIKRVEVLSQVQQLNDARAQWIEPLRKVSLEWKLDVDSVLKAVTKQLEREARELEESCPEIVPTKDDRTQLAGTAVVGAIVMALQNADPQFLQLADSLSQLLAFPPLQKATHGLGAWLKEHSFTELKDWVSSVFKNGEPPKHPPWSELRKDPAQMRSVIDEHYEGNRSAFAEAVGRRAETVSRALNPKATRAKTRPRRSPPRARRPRP